MTVSPESLNSLWAYCSANRRVIPRDWQKLYVMLANKRQRPSGGWEPLLPLILAAWHETTVIEKQLRFKDHIQWAADHNQLDQIPSYLRALPEEQWFHFGEL
jgi:hypothetical protein